MCTLVLLRRPGSSWPLLLAANRDELRTRASMPPARHWPDRPHVRGGLDVLARGSWLGVNDDGMVAAVLNRRGTLGPAPGKRSRGELVLEALDHAEAAAAAAALSELDPDAYRPFNLIVADAEHAFWLRHAGDGPVRSAQVPIGTHMIEAGELDDPASTRIARFLPQFRFVPEPDPEAGDWSSWQALLADRSSRSGDPRQAMTIVTEGDYGTVSASLIALPQYATTPPLFLHAEGLPGEAAFVQVPP
ncbi:MAG: NRDE family protein [Geminicoccaceae bacterium]